MESPDLATVTAVQEALADTETAEEKQLKLAGRSRLLGGVVYAVARTVFSTLRLHR